MEHQDQRMKPPESHNHQPPPPQKCPRCESSNTKFCYYNNYSLSQPRYFCKACRRYWTHGGTLRNVPVGGGCRKSKRPKPSIASSSTAGPHPLPPQTLPGMVPGQPVIRSLPPALPSMANTFYSGGSFLSTLAGMQSLPPAAANLGGGSSQFDASMALLQGVHLPPVKPQPPQQFQVHNEYLASSSIPSRPAPLTWAQTFIDRGPATTTSAATSGFWTGPPTVGDNQAGSSFNPNHWPENDHGFDASQ